MNDAPKPKRRWIWIVGGVVFVLFCIAIGGIIFAVSFFRDNMQVTRDVGENAAVNEFDAVYKRFPGQKPLIQLVDDRPQLVAERASQAPHTQSLNTLHVIAFDRDSDEMVRFTLPFWLLRLKSGPIRLSAYQQGWDDRGVSFRVEDIERHGPGIIVDVTERREGRLLVWAE
ncbi:MAG TPA: hypothetical protein VEA16_04355 [Vicinamibacterales bacterium]|nr:hypothetical protein [Vicinamibacterales bacterium]